MVRETSNAERRLADETRRLEEERILDVSIARLDELTVDSTVVDDLALTITAARRPPDELTVRVRVADDAVVDEASVAAAQTGMQRLAADASYAAWREATTVRNMARRQRPVGIVVSILAAMLAYASWYVASDSETTSVAVLFWVLGGVAITVAWVFSWLLVEDNWYTWRAPAALARAHDVLSRARLEVVSD